MNEINFVRGIAWHDIAKPFYLGRARHSRTGFLLLAAAGYRAEATAALCHVGGSDLRRNLKQYHQLPDRAPLPAVLLLSNELDRLAASSYSFMEAFRPDDLPLNPLPEKRIYKQLVHAWHNPFTHLPVYHPFLNQRLQAEHAQRDQEIDGRLRETMLKSASDPPREHVQELLELGGDIGAALVWPDMLEPIIDESGREVDPIEFFYQYSRAYPERTYPPVNDTLLSEHTRLSAIFAWVAYRNLAAHSHPLLESVITPAPEGGTLPDGSDAVDYVSPRPDSNLSYAPGQALVRDHMGAYLARITFSGHQQWVEEAARLDDLNGAQVLTARMRTAFKRALAERLDVRGLAEFLWISESSFDLVYLLPQALRDKDDPEKVIKDSYEAAVDWLVEGEDNPDSLKGLLEDDFGRADPPLEMTALRQMCDLKAQLRSLGYNTFIERVEPPTEKEDYDAFTAAYGKALLAAYQNSRERQRFPRVALDATIDILMSSEQEAIEDVCTICGTHAVYGPLAEQLPENESLRKVTHTFRGVPERPCLACITRRALAHKQVQVQALSQILDYDSEEKMVRAQPHPELGLPPALLHTRELKDRDDFADVGAAFVRLARKRDAEHPLDIFPTVSYAADSLGNVALLTLSATNAVFAEYGYRETRERLENASDTERTSPAWDLFIQDYDAFCQRIEEKVKAAERDGDAEQEKRWSGLLDQVETVEPHLARVLARQTRISHFFQVVADRLEQAHVRALALDSTYPTGRWMVPAIALPKALEALGRAIASDLLAVPEGALDGLTRRLLVLTAPRLLDGTLVVFKQKFPIYLVMAAERALRAELAAEQPSDDGEWYGVHLALADLRGTLTSRAAGKSVVTLDQLPDLLALNARVDRRSVTGRAADLGRGEAREKWAQEIADARLFVRSYWWPLDDPERLDTAQTLTREDTFAPVLFLKRMARE